MKPMRLTRRGGLVFPYEVEMAETGEVVVARRACRFCFPDGIVDYCGFIVSKAGTAHIPMPDGATVCVQPYREGWWYHTHDDRHFYAISDLSRAGRSL